MVPSKLLLVGFAVIIRGITTFSISLSLLIFNLLLISRKIRCLKQLLSTIYALQIAGEGHTGTRAFKIIIHNRQAIPHLQIYVKYYSKNYCGAAGSRLIRS